MSVAPHEYSAAQKVLSLPELFTMILDAWGRTVGPWIVNQPILSTRDLRNVIRVNRFWFDIGSKKLWAHWESIDWLLRVPPDRRQFYASMMKRVSISGRFLEEYYREYKDIVFEGLTSIYLQEHGVCFFDHVNLYLVPSVQYFHFQTNVLYSGAFTFLKRVGIDLREVVFVALRTVATPGSFLRFLRRYPSLKRAVIYSSTNEDTVASFELLSWLAQSDKLERLRLPWCWTESVTRRVAAAVSHSGVEPFSKLAEITLFASSRAFAKLVPLVANTKYLSLIVKDSTEDVLPHSLGLSNLESLSICYRQACTIPVKSLIDLGALSRLSTLFIYSSERVAFRDIVKCDVSDSDCEALARRLPNLRHLRIRIRCKLSTNALEAFLRHCPNLRKCKIFFPIATTDLFTSPPGDMVFPQLKTLCLGGLSGREIMRRMTPQQFCDSIERQFPGLEQVYIWNRDDPERKYYDQAFTLWHNRADDRF